MRTDLSGKIALVVDQGGLFLPVARRLARNGFGRVFYYQPWEEGFSKIYKAITGDGYNDLERCEDIWEVKDDVDCFVFPDVGMAGLQLELEAQGKRVWGSRKAVDLELDRPLFLKTLAELGLDVPKHVEIIGINKLRQHLAEREDVYIKISKYRGMLETCHWRSWELDKWLLDAWAVKFGPIGDRFPFLVFDAIDTPLEIGGDTYCVDGEWPALMLNGIEAKDKSYFSSVTKREDMPEEVLHILEAFGPVLGKDRYRNEFSMEARVTDTEVFFIDPTCRGGLPSTGSQLELWDNFPQIVWHGAGGEMIDPDPAAQFSMECALTMKGDPSSWSITDVPDELKDAMKLAGCCEVDGRTCFPPDESHEGSIGWLVATGDTPKETLGEIKRLEAMLPDGVSAHIEAIADVIREVHQAQEDGIPFGDQPVPEPAAVVEGSD